MGVGMGVGVGVMGLGVVVMWYSWSHCALGCGGQGVRWAPVEV